MITSMGNSQTALELGLQGYQSAQKKVTNAAAEIASVNKQTDLNENAVDLVSGSIQAQASASVIKRSDDMIGTLIDTLA